ncbi:NADH-quinone oxidoreductase subunit N [Limisalsivibrio acetivorans]|uniref:NADH-quinone oxidoreductase subunit N n=1 Tax=Limisalsivibrio acetivorans TaxID=1304888 RepID=UPI0003B5C6AE|nr:NADH-quinone oxidoreductase subunit N [Limisalsivibrio acetivorans]
MNQEVILNILSIYPEALMTIFALVLIVIDVMAGDKMKSGVGYFGIAFLLFTAVIGIPSPTQHFVGFDNMLVWDRFSYVFFIIFMFAYSLTTLGSVQYLQDKKMLKGEFYIIMFFSIIGMMFMVSALDLSIFYVGLETMAISMYILAGFNKRDLRSNEAGVKYFLIGAFSSGILLYGLTFVYGYTGSLGYMEIAQAIQAGEGGMALKFGLVLMLIGFAFKISAVPFHMWAPDVYTGSPTPVAGFMTVAPKAAAMGALIRFAMVALAPAADQWTLFFSILAVLTMTYGNLVALAQDNVKRMLAYSAISHAGYMMIGLVTMTPEGFKAIAVYMLIYSFMNIGAFTILGLLKNKGMIENERIESFAGLSKKSPMAALAMLLFMFSLAGIPPLAGFVGKFYIFMSAIKAEIYWLAIVGVLNSALACYYYMRVTIFMYFKESEYDVELKFAPASFVATFIAAVVVVMIGFFPSIFVNIVQTIAV